ncbi:MAG TPA: hypothetical protein VFG64_14605, partial [Dongiaceae bacterium]|nr:hypothetical protein [Dongiaceae bacterium]
MRRRTAALLGLIGLIGLLLVAAGAAVFWRKPLTEAAISAYVARIYGVPVTIAIGELGTRSARVDHVKIGRDAPFEAADIRLDYDLDGHIAAVSVGTMSAHGRIEGGIVTLGDLQPLLEGSGDKSQKSEAQLPETISIRHLDLALETPMGGVAIGGSARLGKGALALDLAATDPSGHTKGAAKIDVSSALDHPVMTGDVRITLAPQSPLWALAPAIAPQEGTVEASLHLDQVEAALDPTPGGKPIAVALRLDQVRNARLSAPLSGTLTADVRSTHLPLAIENIVLDLSGGLSPRTKASASGSATLALSGRQLALDLTARIAASDDSLAIAGWQIRQPQITAPIHLTFIDGVLAAALSDDGTVAHKGLTDATKGTSIGAGTLTLQHDSTAFRLNTSDGAWNAQAVTAAVAFSAKSLGETVDLSAPAVTISATSDPAGARWYVNAAKIAFQNKARGVSASNALIKLSGAGNGIAGEIRISRFDAGYGLPTITLNGDGQL